MSGVIELEGKSKGALHPHLGEIKTDPFARRALIDFPALAWFTTRIDTPKCLISSKYFAVKDDGERKEINVDVEVAHAIALNRIALGFRISDIPVVRWSTHRGYATQEGQELNASAREAGDNPDDWYVSDMPVDVLKLSECWVSTSMLKPEDAKRLAKSLNLPIGTSR